MSRPSTTMQAVLDRLAVEDAGQPDPTTVPPAVGRAQSARNNARWNADLPAVAEARDIDLDGIPARRIVPANDRGSDAIFYIHGGGWAFCSPATHEGAARRLAIACAATVVLPDYRLAPEAPYPAGLDDCETAWRALPDGVRWSVAGDSAGANLAAGLMLRLVAAGQTTPTTALLFYGVFGADFDTPSYTAFADGPALTRAKMQHYWDWYAPPDRRGEPFAVPLAATDAQLRALPPVYMNAAGLDPLLSDTETLAQRLAELGRSDVIDVVPGVVHGFMQMGSVLDEAREAFERAGEFFRRRSASKGGPAKGGVAT